MTLKHQRHWQLYMLHYRLPNPNKILSVHGFIARQTTKRTTLSRRVTIFAYSAGSGEEKVELTVEF